MIALIINIAVILCCIFTALYVFVFIAFVLAWINNKEEVYEETTQWPEVTIIIAARNEEENILKCVQCLITQNYPKDKFEIIVVNDHSTDNTNANVKALTEKNNQLKIIDLPENKLGKKEAIEYGIQQSKYEIIVTTDADCIMGNSWLKAIVNKLLLTNNKMVTGPVTYYAENTIFEKFQTLELIALMVSTAGALFYKKAVMCNGANLAYYKKTFYDVGGFSDIKNIPTGDDVLMMYKINRLYPEKISFVKNKSAIVYTRAKQSFKELLEQRKRWASKKISMLNTETKLLGFVVLGCNIATILAILLLIKYFFFCDCSKIVAFVLLINVAIKWIIDFLLLFLGAKYFNKKQLLIYFIPEQLFYSLYFVIIGVFSIKTNYNWKDRTIKSNEGN